MSTYTQFIPVNKSQLLEEGEISCTAPSNIALVKYWGKRPVQLPENPSISFTLDSCRTETVLQYKKLAKKTDFFTFEILFEGKPKPDFVPKIQTFFERVERYLPFLKHYKIRIDTYNNFPHSSGIASSASAFSALAYCLVEWEYAMNPEKDPALPLQKASFLARLGSGSACRSLEGPVTVWGKHAEISGSTDQYAIKFPYDIHENFLKYQDTILLVDVGQKKVSSTVGHNLMYGHPYAESRFQQAYAHGRELKKILTEGDLEGFIALVEKEALALHAMMMMSSPYFILMKPNTLSIIEKIWEFRQNTGSHLCFTLDAGANVHVLYPENEKTAVLKFIQSELVVYCEEGKYICDTIGFGTKLL